MVEGCEGRSPRHPSTMAEGTEAQTTIKRYAYGRPYAKRSMVAQVGGPISCAREYTKKQDDDETHTHTHTHTHSRPINL